LKVSPLHPTANMLLIEKSEKRLLTERMEHAEFTAKTLRNALQHASATTPFALNNEKCPNPTA